MLCLLGDRKDLISNMYLGLMKIIGIILLVAGYMDIKTKRVSILMLVILGATGVLSLFYKENMVLIDTIGGVMHSYSGSKEMAKEFIKLNFILGISGPVTFKNGKVMKEVVEEIPMEYLITETDSPYLSPEPLRGTRNTSINVKYVAEKISSIKGLSLEEVANATYKNAMNIYNI